jgi:hypothetical protein
VLQATEIGVALVFVDLSVHVQDGGILVAAAIAFFVLAITAHGPLGIVRLCGQRLHLALAVAVAVVVALAPIIPAFRPDVEGIIVIEFGAVGLIRVATLTQTAEPARPVTSGWRRGTVVIDTTATVVDRGTSSGTDGAGQGEGARTDGDPSDTVASAGAAARWAGRTTAAAAASGKQVAAKYGPDAEAQVKRTIRGAGRLAGKVANRLAPRQDPPG